MENNIRNENLLGVWVKHVSPLSSRINELLNEWVNIYGMCQLPMNAQN